jgi:hypothetical protein
MDVGEALAEAAQQSGQEALAGGRRGGTPDPPRRAVTRSSWTRAITRWRARSAPGRRIVGQQLDGSAGATARCRGPLLEREPPSSTSRKPASDGSERIGARAAPRPGSRRPARCGCIKPDVGALQVGIEHVIAVRGERVSSSSRSTRWPVRAADIHVQAGQCVVEASRTRRSDPRRRSQHPGQHRVGPAVLPASRVGVAEVIE